MHVVRGISGRAVRTRRFTFHWPMFAEFNRTPMVRISRNSELPEIPSTISELKIHFGTSMFFAPMELAGFSNNSPTEIVTFWAQQAVGFRQRFVPLFVGSTHSITPRTA